VGLVGKGRSFLCFLVLGLGANFFPESGRREDLGRSPRTGALTKPITDRAVMGPARKGCRFLCVIIGAFISRRAASGPGNRIAGAVLFRALYRRGCVGAMVAGGSVFRRNGFARGANSGFMMADAEYQAPKLGGATWRSGCGRDAWKFISCAGARGNNAGFWRRNTEAWALLSSGRRPRAHRPSENIRGQAGTHFLFCLFFSRTGLGEKVFSSCPDCSSTTQESRLAIIRRLAARDLVGGLALGGRVYSDRREGRDTGGQKDKEGRYRTVLQGGAGRVPLAACFPDVVRSFEPQLLSTIRGGVILGARRKTGWPGQGLPWAYLFALALRAAQGRTLLAASAFGL